MMFYLFESQRSLYPSAFGDIIRSLTLELGCMVALHWAFILHNNSSECPYVVSKVATYKEMGEVMQRQPWIILFTQQNSARTHQLDFISAC